MLDQCRIMHYVCFTGIGVGRVCSFRPLELEQSLILLCLYLQALELEQCLIFLTAEIDKDEMWNGANTTMREAAQVWAYA